MNKKKDFFFSVTLLFNIVITVLILLFSPKSSRQRVAYIALQFITVVLSTIATILFLELVMNTATLHHLNKFAAMIALLIIVEECAFLFWKCTKTSIQFDENQPLHAAAMMKA